MKRRLLAPFALVGSLLLVSCARVGPMTIQLAPTQATSGENLAARDAAVAPEVPPVELDITVQGSLPTYDERILAWSISTRRGLGEELGKLAGAFGINGTVDKPNDDNWLVVDAVTGASASLWSTTQTGGWWNYTSVSSDASTPSAGSGSSTACAPDQKCVDGRPVEPVKPTGLISGGEAIRRTNQYLSRADMVPLNYDLKATEGEWSTDVAGALVLGGVRTNLYLTFSYGGDGVLTYASGPMISIAMAGRYYVVQPVEAVARLNDPRYVVFGSGSVAVRDAVASSTDGSAVTVPMVITGARLTLMEVRLANGTHMLLPSYTYSNEQGDVGSVIAVRDDYLAFSDIDPAVTVDTNVADPGAGSGGTGDTIAPLDNATAKALIGLTEDEAMKVAAEKGWTFRVAMRDGHALMLTDDYSTSRVNVTVLKGLVTAVVIG